MVKKSGLITRDDLVKKFDQVVKQEIINHNNQLAATNIALVDLRKSIEKLTSEHARHIATEDSRFRKIEDDMNRLNARYDTLTGSLSISQDNQANKTENCLYDLARKIESYEENALEISEFHRVFEQVSQQLNQYSEDLINQKIYVHSHLQKMSEEMKRTYEEFKHDLLNKPSEIPEVKDELEKKITAAIVDAEGISKKIGVCMKGSFVIEKKIENLYSLIDRLKKKVEA